MEPLPAEGQSCPSPLEGSRYPTASGEKTHGNLPGKGGRRGAGARPGLCWQLRDPGRHLKVFPFSSGCQEFPGGLDPARSPRLPASAVPGADCSRSQAAPEQRSPNYGCQTASKGVDVPAPLPGMTQPPSPRGLWSVPGPGGFFQPGKWPQTLSPGFKGCRNPRASLEVSAAGHRGVKQLRGLVKGLVLGTGQAESPSRDGSCPGAR